jgi:2-polyprenyl-6-methoxyphenol hydroxylase-like FAD-dependent oxidoreductase
MRVLISGAGVAGPTLAYWLAHFGFTPTIIESAPRLRSGGYIIDFWGVGFDIAERMGILPQILDQGYRVKELRVVDTNNRRVAGFPVDTFSRLTNDRYISIPRSELAASIFREAQNHVETIFGDTVDRIEQSPNNVSVSLHSGQVREFDLVIGADGLHSRIRELVFGPEPRFEKYLGFKVAAVQVEGYSPRDEDIYLLFTEIGQQVGRFTMRDNRTLFLFTFADNNPEIPNSVEAQKAELHKRFGNSGWECPHILDSLDASRDFYFDRVSQIRMPPNEGLWSKGRVSLIGDAASCVSLLAGQGTALAMIAAYILAGELYRSKGDYAQAFQRYQNLFGPFVLGKQNSALRFANSFAPKSKFSLFLRNQIFNLFSHPWIANQVLGRGLADKIELPNY